MKELISHGGLGSRLKPLSDRIPKGFIPFCGTSVVDTIVGRVSRLSQPELLMAIPQGDALIPAIVDEQGLEVQLFETSGVSAMKDMAMVMEKYDEPVMLWWGDSFSGVDVPEMVRFFYEYEQYGVSVMGLLHTTALRELKHWGTVELDRDGLTVAHPLQVTAESGLIKGGVFIFHPAQLGRMKALATQDWDMSKITNAMLLNREFAGFTGVEFKVNVNYGEDLLTAMQAWYGHENYDGRWGYFGTGVVINGRVEIGDNVSIGSDVVLGDGVSLSNALILDGVRLMDRATVIDSVVGPNTVVGVDAFVRRQMIVDDVAVPLTENIY